MPEEFFDITSAQLLLQPEPEYLFAKLAMAAIAKDLAESDVGGLLPGRGPSSQGAPYASADDGALVLSDPISREALKAVVALGSAPGHTIRMNRPAFTNTTYTEASREITAGQTVSVVPVDVSSEQVAITLRRFAGPYDATNSRVAPLSIDEFDSQLSVHKLAAIHGMHLRRDWLRFLDSAVCALMAVCSTTTRPTGMSADNDATTADSFPLDVKTLFAAEAALDTANIPRFSNGRRVCVLHPRQVMELKDDAQFARYAEKHEIKNPLFESYVKSIGNLDIYQSNTLTTATNSSSVVIYRGQMFGPGKVGIGVGDAPRVCASTDDNYGMQNKVIWVAKLGLANLDNRFGTLISST